MRSKSFALCAGLSRDAGGKGGETGVVICKEGGEARVFICTERVEKRGYLSAQRG